MTDKTQGCGGSGIIDLEDPPGLGEIYNKPCPSCANPKCPNRKCRTCGGSKKIPDAYDMCYGGTFYKPCPGCEDCKPDFHCIDHLYGEEHNRCLKCNHQKCGTCGGSGVLLDQPATLPHEQGRPCPDCTPKPPVLPPEGIKYVDPIAQPPASSDKAPCATCKQALEDLKKLRTMTKNIKASIGHAIMRITGDEHDK